MSTIAAYLFDPSAATIRPVQIELATIFDTARFLIGADHLAVHQIDKRHTAYVDDEGLTKPVTCRALIPGNDSEGDAVLSPLLSLRLRPSRGS